jgi:hypothetical protein
LNVVATDLASLGHRDQFGTAATEFDAQPSEHCGLVCADQGGGDCRRDRLRCSGRRHDRKTQSGRHSGRRSEYICRDVEVHRARPPDGRRAYRLMQGDRQMIGAGCHHGHLSDVAEDSDDVDAIAEAARVLYRSEAECRCGDLTGHQQQRHVIAIGAGGGRQRMRRPRAGSDDGDAELATGLGKALGH